MNRIILLLITACLYAQVAGAQVQRFIKQQITTLAGNSMDGRGYVEKGHEKAARYLARKYKEFGLLPLKDSSYLMPFKISVNTFPDTVMLKLGRKELQPGSQFLVVASSNSIRSKMKMRTKDLTALSDSTALVKWINEERNPKFGYILKGSDSFLKKSSYTKRDLYRTLPKGFYIIPQKNKLIWTVARDTIASTIVQIPDTALPRRVNKAAVLIENKLEPELRTYNVTGYVPGTEYPESFIVFTAHYDHLGKMGKMTTFNGASDNASGTAAMLYLAQYYARHPQKYSVAFMAMGAEEAGLLGSKYYTEHPQFPLANIKWLTNLDIMGSAEDGISVVNGKQFPLQFGWLDSINKANNYLPKIIQGDKAANSDHHFFYEAGVPAVFIFTRGGPGYYHDVWDKPNTLQLTNIDNVIKLIQDFVKRVKE